MSIVHLYCISFERVILFVRIEADGNDVQVLKLFCKGLENGIKKHYIGSVDTYSNTCR